MKDLFIRVVIIFILFFTFLLGENSGQKSKQQEIKNRAKQINKEWHNFQNFANWCEDSWRIWMDETWHLDKDILIKGNKVYSPETCCFVPNDINVLFTKRQNHRGDCLIGTNKSSKNRWRAKISKEGNITHLGVFDSQEKAFQAYKTAKEVYIKEVADKWKDLIDPRVYEAMYNHRVEITD